MIGSRKGRKIRLTVDEREYLVGLITQDRIHHPVTWKPYNLEARLEAKTRIGWMKERPQ